MPTPNVPLSRLRDANDAPVRSTGEYVLYWMIGSRRTRANYALDRACEWAATLNRPLIVFEPLRIDYPWASLRLHQFVVDGMRDNAAACATQRVTYYPYIEHGPGAAEGLLEMLARQACVIITDEVPAFFQPHMVAAAARRASCTIEVVDSWGLLPLHATGVAYATAYQFRRLLQRELPAHLGKPPRSDGLREYAQGPAQIAEEIIAQWPPADAHLLHDDGALAELPVDASVLPVQTRGGRRAAQQQLAQFLKYGLDDYHEQGNSFTRSASSALSPFLHFGHIGPHEILNAIARHEDWSPDDVSTQGQGHKEAWWGMRAGAEAYLDELVTWRELSANTALYLPDFADYNSLPDWARATLARHQRDQRPWLYSLEEFAAAATHDPLWNAAQRQLLRDGIIHRYLRMLWGKLILEWSAEPQQAYEIMVELNNRYALDGRDANSWSGITWVLGRYDHPWPERPIYGTVRAMSSRSTARKFEVSEYLEAYG